MDVTRSARPAVAQPAPILPPPEAEMRNEFRRVDQIGSGTSGIFRKTSGYGLPCVKCHLYYPADLDACPTCSTKERISPNVSAGMAKAQAVAEQAPETAVVEKEREAFLKEFKSQLFAAHAEVVNSPVICTLGEHGAEEGEPASICKPCFDRVQERIDVCEAALHIDLKEAAQIVYDAVWADPSDPSKTYTNAASALLTELRKRAGISSMIGPFQPLGN